MKTEMKTAIYPHVRTLKEDTQGLALQVDSNAMTLGDLEHALDRIQERIFYIREICNS
jgi:hypothetical protein